MYILLKIYRRVDLYHASEIIYPTIERIQHCVVIHSKNFYNGDSEKKNKIVSFFLSGTVILDPV